MEDRIPVEPIYFDDAQSRADKFISQKLTKIELGELRRMARITQKDMSRLSGLSTQCISDIESEKSGNPTFKSIVKYLDVLDYEICFRKKVI